VFDAAVNMGPGTAVKLLQRAVNSINSANGQVTVDGGWGPNTVAAANATDQVTLLAAFRRQRENYYVGLGGPFLPEWLARVAK
jgi:lysozyme family protein